MKARPDFAGQPCKIVGDSWGHDMKIIDAQIHIWSQAITPPYGLHRKVQSFTAE